MKLEVGKYYRTSDGRKVGPIEPVMVVAGHFHYDASRGTFSEDGTSYAGADKDIIAEWSDATEVGPVRTVTRHEIVPGKYGNVTVWGDGWPSVKGVSNIDELTDATTTLTTIRDAIQANTTA